MSAFVGVDGCRFGWVAIFEDDRGLNYRLYETMREVLAGFPRAECVLVDIPIGLPWRACPVRPCDSLAREQLRRPRASSVFAVPARTASRAGNIEEARRLNLEELGRSVSAQAWGICGKIAEVDDLLVGEPLARKVIREMHPEVCFWGLNGRQPMQHRKGIPDGVKERQALLLKYEPRSTALLEHALATTRRAHLKADDVLDALVGLVVARAIKHGAESLRGEPKSDERELPMEMVFWNGVGAHSSP